MISYQNSKKILKKSHIKINNEIILSVNSLNRVTSSNVYSKYDYPSGNNAAFDGYAINSNDTKAIKKNHPIKFRIIGTIAAGTKPFKNRNKKYQAVQIMTGGIIPKGFDTIIPNEKIKFYPSLTDRKFILVGKKMNKFNHIRFKGSDYKKKELIIKKNTIIQPNHILALKTLGIKFIKIKKKINILFFSTGNEISDKDEIKDWKVRNSNNHYISVLKDNLLFNFKYGGILRDNHDKIFQSKIKKILKTKTDIIVTSGAVSAGKYDYIPNVIKKFKLSKYFKSVKIRPGKPILFAKFKGKQKAFFGLPGNPMSSAACFRFFIFPYISNLLGLDNEKPLKVVLKKEFIKNKNFTRFVKSKIHTTKNGKLEVEILKGQESFRIKSFVNSNIWTILPSGKSRFKKGTIVDCYHPNYSNQTLIL